MPSPLLRLGFTLLSLLIMESPRDVYDFSTYCDGSKFALVDQEGKYILPAQYGNIEYLGHGLYMACDIRKEDKFCFGDSRLIFNKMGKIQPVSVPAGTTLSKVLWLGEQSDSPGDADFEKLPDDTLLRFRSGNGLGLCDKLGNIIAPGNFNRITDASEGKIFLQRLIEARAHVFIFDTRSKELREFKKWNPEELEVISVGEDLICFRDITQPSAPYRYLDRDENCPFPETFEDAGPFHNGMAVVSISGNPGDLNSRVCIDRKGKVISPSGFSVLDFYGNTGIVSKPDGGLRKYGLADRRFHLVTPFEYDSISPGPDLYCRTIEGPRDYLKRNALHFACYKNEDKLAYLYDGTGRFLFSFPSQYQFDGFTVDGRGSFFKIGNNGLGEKQISLLDVGSPVPKRPALRKLEGQLRVCEPDRFVQVLSTDDGHFDPVYWKNFHELPVSRLEMFARFLRDYNLIGMPRQQVNELLGRSVNIWLHDDPYTYHLARCCVVDSAPTVRLKFMDEKVSSWTLSINSVEGQPVTSNMVFYEKRLKDSSKPSNERLSLHEKL